MFTRSRYLLASGCAALAMSFGAFAAEDLSDGLYAELNTTKGRILLELEFEKTPLTVANFVGLAEGTKDSNKPKGTKFYDGTVFHRVIPGFMIQGGDPEGTGRGGPGYRFADEFDPTLRHTGPGILSMANAGPGSNGSQFFITVGPTPHLDDKHSVFGKVVDGMDVVTAISTAPRNASDRPNEEIKINSVNIIRVGEEAKAFKADQAAFEKLLAGVAARQADKDKARLEAEKADLAGQVAAYSAQHPDAEWQTTPSGLRYLVTAEGSGEKPKPGTVIRAHYTGKFPNGEVFDSSVQRNQPFAFPVKTGRVIPGWDEALSDMKKGEKRVLVVPPHLAYGPRGAGGVIPPNATLIFEVELLDF